MSRLPYVGVVLLLLLGSGVFFWWTFSTPATSPPPQQALEQLSDSVDVRWTNADTAIIDATTTSDALTALGYVHGMTRAWTVTIWRRVALGQLSEQFGTGLAPLDRHAQQLGFERHARSAYAQLPGADRRQLRAYARGLNAALESERIRHREPFVFFDLAPQQWKPWHSLAVERLLSWMATHLSSPRRNRTNALEEFLDTDRNLRRFLHLHGWDRSISWAIRPLGDTTGASLFSRHVLGSGADPILQETIIRRSDRSPVTVASLPGAPLFPTGSTEDRAWSYLLDSPVNLAYVQTDSARIRDWHERLRPTNSEEKLVHVYRQGTNLLLQSPVSARRGSENQRPHSIPRDSLTRSSDSAWVVQWPGFRSGSDVGRWLSAATLRDRETRASSVNPRFRLMRGRGLTLNGEGNWTVQGDPPVIEESPRSILIGQTSWARHQANALHSQAPFPGPGPAALSTSDSSTWAASLLPRLLPDLEPLRGRGQILNDALPYLRNWDHRYEASSIGAVLFEQWIRAYRREIDRLPSPTDPAFFAAPRRRRAFQKAIAGLLAEYGSDVRRWRWERVAENRRHFLVWSSDSLISTDLRPLSRTRFAPLSRRGHGHASTLAGGPALVDSRPLDPSPTQWTGWTRNQSHQMTVRRLRFNPSAFFARSLLTDKRPPAVSTSSAEITKTTRLVPTRQ